MDDLGHGYVFCLQYALEEYCADELWTCILQGMRGQASRDSTT